MYSIGQFYGREGNEGILKLTNFTCLEFRAVYSKSYEEVIARWNVGRGTKTTQNPMDISFTFPILLKCCGSWNVLAKVLEMKAPTFECLVTEFMKIVLKSLCEFFVDPIYQSYLVECLQGAEKAI